MQFEPSEQFEQRRKKLEQIQALGFDPFPGEFRWTETPAALVEAYAATPGPELDRDKREVRVAGRIVSYRLMGKAGFAHLQGSGKRIQIYVKKDVVGESGFQLFHLLDLGDPIGVRGHLFRTKTRRAFGLGRGDYVLVQSAAAAAREMARACGYRAALPATLSGPGGDRKISRSVSYSRARSSGSCGSSSMPGATLKWKRR